MNTPEEDKLLEQRAKVTEIARELTLRGGKLWTLGKQQYINHCTMNSSDGHVIHVSFGGYGNQNRIKITGGWPKYKTNATPTSEDTVTPRDYLREAVSKGPVYNEITVADTKDGTTIGVDISRRFLPGYFRLWNVCKEVAVRYERDAREAKEAAAALSKAVGGDRVEGHGLEASFWISKVGKVRITSHEGKQTVYIERILGLPPKVAAVVINAVSGAE